ncbi:PstS family phosphate ABC transporter substrate-binding protein [Aliikangiella sp. IMCC44359]|uniref:PstS family phosphate ABC transporter substrate-binding protein n=1 Tax=Aliikangiella sp. IMCC44359 TaxID=3459125 RepID=UPI00403AD518
MLKNLSTLIVAAITITLIFLGIFKFNILQLPVSSEDKTEQSIENLLIKGSNTVGENFAPLLAKSFLKNMGAILIREHQLENPVEKYIEGTLTNKNKTIRIEIRAHGSSTGFKALGENSTDIAMSSRAIKEKESSTLFKKYGEVGEHPIALDALAIVTYPNNPINTLTISQIADLFSGKITNWTELGGEDYPVSLFSRDNNSGTWDTFKSLVLKPYKKELDSNSQRFESSNELVDGVIDMPGSIGFVGVSYVGSAKLLKVAKSKNGQGKKPTGYTIGTQDYPLSRKLYLYTIGKKQSKLANSFIDFVVKNEGQKQAEKVGLISYYPTHYRPETLDKSTPIRYKDLASLGRRITVNFSPDLFDLDRSKELRDIQRLMNFTNQNPGKKIILVDFSNSPRLAQLKIQLENHNVSVLDTLNIPFKNRLKDPIEVWAL